MSNDTVVSSPSQNRKRGFTLTEIAIVLGIIGLILGAVWAAASSVYSNANASTFTRSMSLYIAAIRGACGQGCPMGSALPEVTVAIPSVTSAQTTTIAAANANVNATTGYGELDYLTILPYTSAGKTLINGLVAAANATGSTLSTTTTMPTGTPTCAVAKASCPPQGGYTAVLNLNGATCAASAFTGGNPTCSYVVTSTAASTSLSFFFPPTF